MSPKGLTGSLASAAVAGVTVTPALGRAAEVTDRGKMTEVGGALMRVGQRLTGLTDSAVAVFAAAPRALADFAASWQAIAAPIAGQRPFLAQLGVIAAALLICLLVVLAVRMATRFLRDKCAADTVRSRGSMTLLIIEAADRAALFAVAYAAMEWWFGTDSPQDRLAVAALWASVRWWSSMLIVGALLRPGCPALRLIRMGEKAARALSAQAACILALGIGVISVMPLLLSVGMPIPSAQFLALLLGTAMAGGTAIALFRLRSRRRSEEKAGHGGRRLWLPLAIVSTAALWLVWSVDVLLLDFTVYHALAWSVGVVALIYVADAVLGLSADAPPAPPADGNAARPSPPSRLMLLRRLVRVAAGMIVAFILADEWFVDRLGVIPSATWSMLRPSLISAAVSLFVGYVAWELLHHWTRRKLASLGPVVGPGEDNAAAPASRLSTALPLLRLLLGIGIVVMAVLVALSQLGVDVGPLIAGASIFGLAISFGSQALVRDIVSGIFFMADDAFRVGEYIDTGRLKGTVEKISVRSVRLRHQNGQIHTIPYGQLTSTTNFSRDWATMKFNLRLARDSDIEKVRKTLKQIGQDMLQDPELGQEFLEPLKLQGIADVIDNALVCRVKFTVRPIKPTWVQRQALKRIHGAFKEKGIEFASNAVTVQTAGRADPSVAAAAASASARRAPEMP
jgi:moderate conductance mechanosensitive channel